MSARIPTRALLTRRVACTGCGNEVSAYDDPEGIWWDCPCDQGYVLSPYVSVDPLD